MAGAAGGFVTRAFESMLKECSGKKLTSLQTAIQSYLGLYFCQCYLLNVQFFCWVFVDFHYYDIIVGFCYFSLVMIIGFNVC